MRSSASPARPKNAACPRLGIRTRDLCLCYSQHANTIQDLSASFQLTTWGPLLGCAFWSRTFFWWWDHASRTLHDAQGVGSRNQPQNRAQSAPVLSPRWAGRLELVSISHLSQLALGCAQNFPTSAHPAAPIPQIRPTLPNSVHPLASEIAKSGPNSKAPPNWGRRGGKTRPTTNSRDLQLRRPSTEFRTLLISVLDSTWTRDRGACFVHSNFNQHS